MSRTGRLAAWLCAGWIVLCSGWIAVSLAQTSEPPDTAHIRKQHAAPTPAQRVHGQLLEMEGVPVLRVWGTPHQRGHAQGCLLGKEIVSLFDRMITAGLLGGDAEGYTNKVIPMLSAMHLEDRYREEIKGILDGIETLHNGPVEIPSLHRRLLYEDLLALNCMPDLARMGCSSFAAWGPLTKDSGTLVGRNLDWFASPALRDTSILLVEQPQGEKGRLGWVSMTCPGLIACITGINEAGVVVSMHDAPADPPTAQKGFAPRGFILRDIVESAHSEGAFKQAETTLKNRTCAVGNNVMISRPWTDKTFAAIVFEFDGDKADHDGLTRRSPGRTATAKEDRPGAAYITCTNHYRKRKPPTPCDRYTQLDQALKDARAARKHITVNQAWKMLAGAAFPRGDIKRIITHQSAVFELNTRKLHMAFSQNGKPAPACRHITLDLDSLLKDTKPLSRQQ